MENIKGANTHPKMVKSLFYVHFPNIIKFFSCGVIWGGTGQHPMNNLTYVTYIYTFGFVVPFTIISTSYYKIICTVKYRVSI